MNIRPILPQAAEIGVYGVAVWSSAYFVYIAISVVNEVRPLPLPAWVIPVPLIAFLHCRCGGLACWFTRRGCNPAVTIP